MGSECKLNTTNAARKYLHEPWPITHTMIVILNAAIDIGWNTKFVILLAVVVWKTWK